MLKSKPTFYRIVQKEIQSVEQLMIDSIQFDRPDVNLLLKNLFTAGGKRIRPNIALLLGKLMDANLEKIIILCAAIEMLHTATLVHDDLIDNSLFRRGNSTLNAIWTPAATVLAGDYLFAIAAEHAANTDSLPVMKMFSQTLSIIVRGEITQFLDKDYSLDLQRYYDRIFAKTASLFKTTSSAVGILVHAESAQQEALDHFGYAIGMAFQIIDDVLDFSGDQKTMGKPIGSDLRNNILTLPALLYFQDQPEDYQLFIKHAAEKDSMLYDQMVERILAGKTIEQSLSHAKEFITQAIDALNIFTDNQYRAELVNLTQHSLVRVL